MIKIVNNKLVLVIDKTRKSKKKNAGSFYLIISHGLLFLLVLNLKYKNEPAFYHGFYDTII